MKQLECQRILDSLPNDDQAKLLLLYGHQMTIIARDAYEFQGSGVIDPRLLRDINEINHRLFLQVKSLVFGEEPEFPNEVIASWIMGEDKPKLQKMCSHAIEYAIQIKNT